MSKKEEGESKKWADSVTSTNAGMQGPAVRRAPAQGEPAGNGDVPE
jgi:hypothetical protein